MHHAGYAVDLQMEFAGMRLPALVGLFEMYELVCPWMIDFECKRGEAVLRGVLVSAAE